MPKLRVIAVAVLGAAALIAGPQMLVLRDGRTIPGTFVSSSGNLVVFRDDNGIRHQYSFNEIQSIDFNTGSQAYNSGNYNGRYDNGGRYENSNRAYNSSGNYGSNRGYANRASRYGTSGAMEVPAGTQVTVRTDQAINSDVANSGQTFPAVISQDVMGNNGEIVIPRGSPAQLAVNQVQSGGVTGSPTLTLALQSVTVNGRTYLVDSETVQQSGNTGIGANKRTAEMVGGGAALGTLLGAIAGGGKGAAIGAAIGAIGGGTAQVLTRGSAVHVPAESELTFRLDQNLLLTPR